MNIYERSEYRDDCIKLVVIFQGVMIMMWLYNSGYSYR